MKKTVYLLLVIAFSGILINSCSYESTTKAKVSNKSRAATDIQKKQTQIATFILVRHAEKELTGKNPPLTTAGKSRAIELAKLLEGVEIDAIFSSNYKRTLETAQPTATAKNIKVTMYDPSDLNAFARVLMMDSSNRTKLIVGHSNTTPDLINILLKEKRLEHISEKGYDDVFILTLLGNGSTKLLPLKYGSH